MKLEIIRITITRCTDDDMHSNEVDTNLVTEIDINDGKEKLEIATDLAETNLGDAWELAIKKVDNFAKKKIYGIDKEVIPELM